ncbi:MAG: hypothetical protein QOK80_08730, partial [Nitrososphaeraceae archaeon]|nr:hypothetical protein [Nitrososphaeraceae archaeon]
MTLEFKKFSSFIFLLIFLTLTMPILSSPFQLANNVDAETDSNSDDDAKDDGSKDDGDDGPKDD